MLAVLLAAMAGGWWVRDHVLGSFQVESGSMAPTLCTGDQVLVDKRATGESLELGDLVVVKAPDDGRLVVKRVVGLPGDRVAIRDALLFVDGHRVSEPYVDHRLIDALFYGPTVVPPAGVLVMGDARAVSIDSRDYGPVDFSAVRGEVLMRLWTSCE